MLEENEEVLNIDEPWYPKYASEDDWIKSLAEDTEPEEDLESLIDDMISSETDFDEEFDPSV